MENYNELMEKLSQLQWLLGRRQMRNRMEHGPCADPTSGQGRVLTLLKMQPEISTRDLSYLLGIRQQSLNELLNKLEKSEYVLREPSEADRRVMLVKLTEKGKTQQQMETDYSEIFSCLSEEEQASLSDYLDRIMIALETELGIKDDEKMEAWGHAACDRMGDEKFERFVMGSGKLHGWGYYGSHGERFQRGFGHGECGSHSGHGRHGGHGCLRPEGRGSHPFDHGYNKDNNEKKSED